MNVPFPEPTGPPAPRAEVLLGYLDYFRCLVVSKVQGLGCPTPGQSAAVGLDGPRVGEAQTHVEQRWLVWGFEGQPVARPWKDTQEGHWYVSDPEDGPDLVHCPAGAGRRHLVSFGRMSCPTSGGQGAPGGGGGRGPPTGASRAGGAVRRPERQCLEDQTLLGAPPIGLGEPISDEADRSRTGRYRCAQGAEVKPKMSLLPNGGEGVWQGDGFGSGLLVARDWRKVSTAGQSAALRTSFHTIRATVVITQAYAISGLCAGLAGIVTASQLSSAQAGLTGNIVFDVITLVVVGGTSLAGGFGAMWRTGVGLGILATLQVAFNLLNINPYFQDIVEGVIIVSALALDSLTRKLAGRRLTSVFRQPQPSMTASDGAEAIHDADAGLRGTP